MIRVFAKKTKWTPTDELAFFGEPPLFELPDVPVFVSVTFTWDIERGMKLFKAWRGCKRFYKVCLDGPAYGTRDGEFEPGRFLKKGVTITSRGCPKKCSWCLVPNFKHPAELIIKPGHIIQDDNLLACSRGHIEKVFDMLSEQKAIKFSGGLDIDYLKSWHVDMLKQIKVKEIFVSCDDKRGLARLDKAADLLSDFSIEKKRCYVLVGFEGETQDQAQARCEAILAKGFLPFAQLYRSEKAGESRGDWREFCWFWSQPRLYRAAPLKGAAERSK